jgi:hypothetical protein
MADEYELTEAPITQASGSTMPPDEVAETHIVDFQLHNRTLLKLDYLLLPFLALLFLFNALDKANVSIGAQFNTSKQEFMLTEEDWKCRIRTLHRRYWARQGRHEHSRSPLFRLLRHPTTPWRRVGKEIWHGALGAELHDTLGILYGIACLGTTRVAAVYFAHLDRLSGGYLCPGFMSIFGS